MAPSAPTGFYYPKWFPTPINLFLIVSGSIFELKHKDKGTTFLCRPVGLCLTETGIPASRCSSFCLWLQPPDRPGPWFITSPCLRLSMGPAIITLLWCSNCAFWSAKTPPLPILGSTLAPDWSSLTKPLQSCCSWLSQCALSVGKIQTNSLIIYPIKYSCQCKTCILNVI